MLQNFKGAGARDFLLQILFQPRLLRPKLKNPKTQVHPNPLNIVSLCDPPWQMKILDLKLAKPNPKTLHLQKTSYT